MNRYYRVLLNNVSRCIFFVLMTAVIPIIKMTTHIASSLLVGAFVDFYCFFFVYFLHL